MDAITYQAASDIDRAWCDARWPSDGLRIVVDWVGGQGNVTHLRVPGMNYSPLYQWREYTETGEFAPAFYHVSGPTLADWQRNQFNEIDLGNEAHYRSLAAESQDATNVALFTERADFYAQRASRR